MKSMCESQLRNKSNEKQETDFTKIGHLAFDRPQESEGKKVIEQPSNTKSLKPINIEPQVQLKMNQVLSDTIQLQGLDID